MDTPKRQLFHLYFSNVAKPVWCSGCSRPFVGAKWFCPCNRTWSNCPDHPPRSCNNEERLTGKRKAPRAVSPHEAEAKFDKIEPGLASRALMGPKLSRRFPHLVSGIEVVARIIDTHKNTPADALAVIAAADPVASDVGEATTHEQPSQSHNSYHIREDLDSHGRAAASAAVDAPPAVANAGSTAGADVDRPKRKSRPFRIPKR